MVQKGRPRIRPVDRAFWIALRRVWSRWADILVIVKTAYARYEQERSVSTVDKLFELLSAVDRAKISSSRRARDTISRAA